MIHAAVLLASPILVPYDGPTYWRGADMSFIPEYRDLRTQFFVDDELTDPLGAMKQAGMNMLRLRVWVNPPTGYCSAEKTIQMSKEAKKLGMGVMIDFHYSDDWADPQHQIPPAAWSGLSLSQLASKVEGHTFDTLMKLKKVGIQPEIVAVGNEVRDGMLWPIGRISKNGYDGFATLLKAGIRGVEKARLSKSQIMIHHDSGGDQKKCDRFYSELQKRGVRFDCIGLSYYPWWHGTFADLRGNLDNLANKFKKPVIVTETAFPFTVGWKDRTGNFVWNQTDLKCEYKPTIEGQVDFLKRLHAEVKKTPKDLGQGVLYWAPEYVAQPGIQTPYENLALFDFQNRLLPGAYALGEKPIPKS